MSLERQERVSPSVVNAFWIVCAGRLANSESGHQVARLFKRLILTASAFPFVKHTAP